MSLARPAGGWRRRLCLAVLAVLVAGLLLVLLDWLFPPRLPSGDGDSTLVLARDGTPLRAFADVEGEWRYPVRAEQVSPLYRQALLGYEDRWFYRHPGVNPYALVRGALLSLRHGRPVSGGSTLSMQVARILDPMPHSPAGKLVQLLRALQLEAHLSKNQILELYLNHAPFGGTIQGVQAASWAYLGKPAARLSHAEAALLAVLPQAPSRLRPDRHPQAARRARDKVLRRLQEQGLWSRQQVQDAFMEPVVARSLRAPLDAALLARRLHRQLPHARRIRTTLDAGLQRAVQERVGDFLSRWPPQTSVAVLVVDNASLEARVYLGSAIFGDPGRAGHLDMVRARRSPGSTLKPFLYGLALDDGLIHSQSLLVDAPQDFSGYRPSNFGDAFHGPVSAAEALQLSLNVPAVEVLEHVGPARFLARLAHGGVHLRLPAGAAPNLSVILGGGATRLEELVGAYSALANDGLAGAPRYLHNAKPAPRRRLLSPGAAWIVRDMLTGNPAAAPAGALADARLAWKTGTSYGYRDAWAMGVEDRWTLGVWVGRPDGTPSPGQYGAITALPLLLAIDAMLPHQGGRPLRRPASVVAQDICWPLGRATRETAPELCRQRRRAWILDNALPPTFAENGQGPWSGGILRLRVNAQGQRLSAGCRGPQEQTRSMARWPALAMPWLPAAERAANSLPSLAPGCPPDSLGSAQSIHIAGLNDGARLQAAPNAGQPLRVTLHALGTEESVHWLLDGRLQGVSQGLGEIRIALPQAGSHGITAVAASGAFAQIRLEVGQAWPPSKDIRFFGLAPSL